MADLPDPSNAAEDLKPELRTGLLGVPYVAPAGAPDLPGGDGPGDMMPDMDS